MRRCLRYSAAHVKHVNNKLRSGRLMNCGVEDSIGVRVNFPAFLQVITDRERFTRTDQRVLDCGARGLG